MRGEPYFKLHSKEELIMKTGNNLAKTFILLNSLLLAGILFMTIFFLTPSVYALDVNVRNSPYNAAGNGTTNDRVAIQNAINDVNAAGGGTVNLPGGYTFLTGDLEIKSNVTININANAVLLSSMTLSHYAHQPEKGRRYNTGLSWDDKYMNNYPLIYGAPGTTNVKVLGSGTIRIGEASGGDDNQIFISPVGFYQVNNFEIGGISMRRGKGYHIQLHSCKGGYIHDVNIDDCYTGSDFNCDGVSMEGCQDMHIAYNYMYSNDDLVYPWSSYQDPRGGPGGIRTIRSLVKILKSITIRW